MFPCPAPRLLLGQPAPLGFPHSDHVRSKFPQGPQRVLTFFFCLFGFCFFFSSALSDQRPALVENEMGDIAAWEVVRDTATVCSDESFGDLHAEPLQDAPFFVTLCGHCMVALGSGSRVGLEGFQALWAVGVLLFLLGWVT